MTAKENLSLNWRDKILTECIGHEPPPCQAACPLNIRVREKLRFLQEGKTAEALALVLERCPFPGILSRICARPCEAACPCQTLGSPLAIAGLKRHLADLDPDAVRKGEIVIFGRGGQGPRAPAPSPPTPDGSKKIR